MPGVFVMLFGFFAACWIFVAGYHTGLFLEVPYLSSFTKGMLPLAYTGAALSVCLFVTAIFAGASQSHE